MVKNCKTFWQKRFIVDVCKGSKYVFDLARKSCSKSSMKILDYISEG